jgi:hypothetical protein
MMTARLPRCGDNHAAAVLHANVKKSPKLSQCPAFVLVDDKANDFFQQLM